MNVVFLPLKAEFRRFVQFWYRLRRHDDVIGDVVADDNEYRLFGGHFQNLHDTVVQERKT